MRARPRRAVLLAWAMCLGLITSGALGAQTPAASPTPLAPPPVRSTVDHAAFDRLLQDHVRKGVVDYEAFARDTAFGRYLHTLSAVDVTRLDETEQLAFWINVYNAYTIQLIVSHGERTSIRRINRTLGVLQLKGPWNEPLVRAAGRTLSLDEVYHRIIRKQFREPRVHFAIVPAAKGAAPLRSEAYTGARLDAQLTDQTRQFLRESPTKNRFRAGVFWLSPIFSAYRSDFGSSRAEFGEFLMPFFEGTARTALQQGLYRQRETPFDWSLNGTAAGGAGTAPAAASSTRRGS